FLSKSLDGEGAGKVTGNGSRRRSVTVRGHRGGAAVGRGRLAGQFVAVEVTACRDDVPELLSRPVQPYPRIASGDTKHVRDLIVAQPAERAEHQDIAVIVGKLPDLGANAGVHILFGELLLGGWTAIDIRRADCRGARVIVGYIGKGDRQRSFGRRPA